MEKDQSKLKVRTVISTAKLTISRTEFSDSVVEIIRSSSGFSNHELLGIAVELQDELLTAMGKNRKNKK